MTQREEIFFEYACLKDKNFPLFSFRKFAGDFQNKRPDSSHLRGQFIFPEGGAVKVYAENTFYLIPAGQTIWIPPGMEHEMLFNPESCPIIFSLIDLSESARFGNRTTIFNVNPLVTELLKRSVEIGGSYRVNTSEFRLITVLMDELGILRESKLLLPLVRDQRLQRITNLLIRNPSSKFDLDYLAKIACMSKRNMTRLFEKETGMTVNAWIRQQKVLSAIDRLDKGETVSSISIGLGYSSLSAFISAFKEITGKTPGTFFDRK